MNSNEMIQQEVKRIVHLLVEKNYGYLAEQNMLGDLNQHEIEQAVLDYGENISMPPDSEYRNMDIFQIEKDGFPEEYSIDFDLWTNNQKSDLTLSCEGKIFEDGRININIYSIHVL